MVSDDRQELSKARNIAFRLLKIRERSVLELRQKLAIKKISVPVIDQTVDFLITKKFLDDRLFAKNWIRYRQARPFGEQRIRLELRQKGIDEEIISEELKEAFQSLDQIEILEDLASRRAKRYKNDEPFKRKRKVFNFLVRRGFNLDVINKVIKNI